MYALGWTVLHSLWQAMLVALLLAGAMILLQGRKAKLRYHLANGSLVVIVGLAVYTFFSFYTGAGADLAEETVIHVPGAGVEVLAGENSFLMWFEAYFNEHMPLIVVIWFMGMVIFLLRMLGGLAYVEYLKNRFTKQMPKDWNNKLLKLSKKLSLKRKVRLLESALVTVPMVIGWLKPVVLIPVGAVNGLTAEQAEAVLAHELAHISRHDFLFNLIQSLVEVIFYFNPAVWWVSGIIRTERENCCDDIALELCEDRLAYAKALVVLEEQNKTRVPGMALAFSSGRKQMLNRISRILNHPQNKSKIMEKFVITSLLILTVLAVSMSEYNAPETREEAPEEIKIVETLTDTGVETEVFEVLKPNSTENEVHIVASTTVMDTLPQGKNRLVVEKDDQKMEVEIEDGEIKSLKIDGKEIPEVEYDNHIKEVEEMWELEPTTTGNAWYFSSDDDRNMWFTPTEEGNFKFHFKSDNDNVFVYPDVEFAEDFQFLNKDGESIFVYPEMNIEIAEAFGEEYQIQMDKLRLHLEEAEVLNEAEMKELMEKQRAIEKKHLHELKRNNRIARDEMRIIRERDRERMLKERRKVERRARERRDISRRQYEEAIILQNQLKNNNALFLSTHKNGHSDMLISHMIENGAIENPNDYKVELSGKYLKIDGKKQNDAMHQKYLELYEALSGFELGKKSKIVIEKD